MTRGQTSSDETMWAFGFKEKQAKRNLKGRKKAIERLRKPAKFEDRCILLFVRMLLVGGLLIAGEEEEEN